MSLLSTWVFALLVDTDKFCIKREVTMNKSDVLELRKRLKKESCTISRMAGCYVDAYKNKVLKLNENFLNLPEEEFNKFLDVAKKTLGGSVGNNILELDFPEEEENPGGRQQFFAGLRGSELKNEELLDRLYDLVIENYQHVGNFLILVFRDTYDIMTRTTDKLKLDESEEVYEYLLVSVCPVALSKPGLGYREDENRIGARIRDWVVCPPELGFLFPAFNDHGADIHRVDYFVKDPKNSQPEFAEAVLGCNAKRTAEEQKKTFTAIVKQAYGSDEDKAKQALVDIQESMNIRVENAKEEAPERLSASIVLDENIINEILEENEIDKAPAEAIKEICREEFADEQPAIEHLIDKKTLKEGLREKKERELVKEVAELKQKLDTAADVVLCISPDKEELIREQIIDDQRYMLIPINDNEEIRVNGKKV